MNKIFSTMLLLLLIASPVAWAQDAMDDLNDAYSGESDYFEGNPSETNPVPDVPEVQGEAIGYQDNEGNYHSY